MKKTELFLLIVGVLGCGWVLTKLFSISFRDPSSFIYILVFWGFFGLVYLGLKDRFG